MTEVDQALQRLQDALKPTFQQQVHGTAIVVVLADDLNLMLETMERMQTRLDKVRQQLNG